MSLLQIIIPAPKKRGIEVRLIDLRDRQQICGPSSHIKTAAMPPQHISQAYSHNSPAIPEYMEDTLQDGLGLRCNVGGLGS